ncbi:hypothetical protein BJ508DRAFT_71186 [Ascobolus immersus RN42]|uniref:CCD97-like C-terminal domain-containing protein n=1 Tax=Ascobolus immersus RN42 TaxID=1160509 RepID=A0A3N4IP09_ASCIM|nr:hypothetical protein BJ508DRAFT_71186 [Ascobolus immersus RN42]
MFDVDMSLPPRAPSPMRTPSPSPAPTLDSITSDAPTPADSTATSATTPVPPSRTPTPSQFTAHPRPPHHTIRNRRLHYLTLHPTYTSSPDHELAAPLLYDKCIRRFQTAKEREEEGRKKGWSGVLYADLERAEAKMEAVRREEAALERIRKEKEQEEDDGEEKHEDKNDDGDDDDEMDTLDGAEEKRGRKRQVRFGEIEDIEPEPSEPETPVGPYGAPSQVLEEQTTQPETEWVGEWGYENEEIPTKEEGQAIWTEFVTRRFLEGRDADVDYDSIDLSEAWDDVRAIERDMEDRYFESETPEEVAVSTDTGVLDY